MDNLVDKCRLCLGPHDCINIRSYIDGKTKLSAVLNQLAGVQYPDTPAVPKNLCETCFDKARDTYLFQQMCYKSLEQILKLGDAAATVPETMQPSPIHLPPVVTKVESVPVDIVEGVFVAVSGLNVAGEQGIASGAAEKITEAELLTADVTALEVDDQQNDIQFDEDEEEEEDKAEDQGDHRDPDVQFNTSELLVQFSAVPEEPRVPAQKRSSPRVTPKKGFECKECNCIFPRKRLYTDHMKEVHEITPAATKIYMCTKCLKRFDSAELQKEHEEQCQDLEAVEKPFVCNICYMRFNYKKELKAHEVEHDDVKRFFCPVCMARFTRSSQVAMHMRTHTQEKPYQCPECKMAFAKRANMVRHQQTHNAEQLFVCSVCDKSFKWETSLKVHMNTHAQIRVYKCDQCKREYTSMSGYRKHIQLVHGEVHQA